MRSFEKKVEQYIMQHQLIKRNSHLLVACSGGVDSMALLHFLRKKWTIIQFNFHASPSRHKIEALHRLAERNYLI